MSSKYIPKRIAIVAGVFLCFVAAAAFFGRTVFEKSSNFLVPTITATMTAALLADANANGFVNPGDTLRYDVVIQNAGTDATGVNFNDVIDANTTLAAGTLIVSPIAVNDSFSSIGNVGISVPAGSGVFTNDLNPNGGTLSVVTVNVAGLQGTLSINTTTGAFDFTPNPGFEGNTTFTYTLSNGTGLNDTATVTINVSGMIWFVNASAGVNGDGRLNAPFNSLANFNAGAADDPNDNIFLFESGTAYSGGITLLSGQKLIGQDATATLASATGITVPSFSSPALPTMNSANGTVSNVTGTTTLNTNSVVRGLSINSTTSAGINDPAGAITGVSISEVAITTTTASAVLLSDLGGTLSFRSISTSSAAIGISLTNTTGSFTVTGNGGTCTAATPTCTGGTITNPSDTGVKLTNASNIALTRMRINGSGNFGLNGTTVNVMNVDTCLFDGTQGNAVDEGALYVTNWLGSGTISNSDISGGANDTVRVTNTTGVLNRLTISGTTIHDNFVGSNHGLRFATNLASGTGAGVVMNLTVTGSTLRNNRSNHFDAGATGQSSMNLVLTNNTFATTSPFSTLGAAANTTLDHQASLTFDYDGNIMNGSLLTAVNFITGNLTTAAASLVGKFRNNLIGTTGVVGSGSAQGGGVTFTGTGSATTTASVTGNLIRRVNDTGINFNAGQSTSPTVNGTITGNTVKEGDAFSLNAIRFDMGNTAAGVVTACGDIGGAGALSNNVSGFLPPNDEIRVRQRNSSAVRLPGYGGASLDTAAVNAYLAGRNTVTPGLVSSTVNVNGFTGGAACVQPPIAPPAEGNLAEKDDSSRSNFSFLNTLYHAPTEFMTGVQPFGKYPTSRKDEFNETANFVETSEPATSNYLILISGIFSEIYSGLSEAISPTAYASGETVSKAIGSLPAGKSVTLRFDATVDANIPTNKFAVSNQGTISGGNFANVQTDDPGVGGAADPTNSVVVHPPTVSKAFGTANIANGGTTSLTFTIGNANPGTNFTNVAFADTLPAGMVIATPNGLVNNCGGGTVTATAGSNSFSVSALLRNANTTCTIVINVMATTEGAKSNTTAAIASLQGGTGLTSNTVVLNAINAPAFTKNFGVATLPQNTSTSLSFTATNNSAAFGLNNVSFTDSLPAGLVVATPPMVTGACGGGTITAVAGSTSVSLSNAALTAAGNCTFSVNITATTQGMKNNSVVISTTELGAGAPANASVNVLAPTAANVSVSGRVLTQNGRAVFNAEVQFTNSNGEIRHSRTNPFGYYRINELTSGETYVITVASKSYRFTPQVVLISEDSSELNLFVFRE